ncbi:transposase [Streptomyces sp. A1547]|nr:transposase [Streptomyces sp. A1547]
MSRPPPNPSRARPGRRTARFTLADRAPVRRPHPGPACLRPRTAEGRAQPALDPASARHDLADLKQLADAAAPEELFTGQWQNRISVLDDYKSYLDDRWNEGFTNAWKLWEEIVPLGYKGSYQRVRAYLHKKRTSPRPVTARPPSPRTVSGWILSRPETLTEPEQLQLKTVRAHCPELDALTRHVRAFAVMLTERQGEHLPAWLDAVRQDDLPSLHTLAAGIDRDLDAVTAGLTLPWSLGAVEGHVNRIKMLKRQMFGRAGFTLLRKRVLVAQ